MPPKPDFQEAVEKYLADSGFADLAIAAIIADPSAMIDLAAALTPAPQTVLVAGAISPSNPVTYLSGASDAYAVTLAAPDAAMIGRTKVIEYTVGAGVVTLDATNIDDTGDFAPTLDNTFSVVGQTIVLLGLSNKWLLLEQSHTA